MGYLNPHTHRLDRSKSLADMTAEIRANNIEKGWRRAEGGPGDNTIGDYIALLHSELSEALEAYRDHRLQDATELYECPSEGCYGVKDCGDGHQALLKPEGVGSEFADVLIRLLDMCDIFGIDLFDMDVELADVATLDTPSAVADMAGLLTFGDWIEWLHGTVTDSRRGRVSASYLMRALVTAAEHFEIDLTAEYKRKMAYNRTRSFQHGGRTLSGTDA
jgi:NTP pyrophosphatase (non-canonical NTP hydrolase)